MDVHIAIINHGHGTDIYLGTTHEEMIRQVAEYVDDNWESASHGEKPEENAISKYFEAEGNSMGGEYWEDRVLPIEGDIAEWIKAHA